MLFFSFTNAIFFSMFLILLISFYKQVLLRNLFFLDLHLHSFEIRRIKLDWQSASRKPKMAASGVSGRRVITSFSFNCKFFQKCCVIVQSQKRCVIFSPKELQKEQDDVVESPKTKSFSFR